jgi:hypothetical protein
MHGGGKIAGLLTMSAVVVSSCGLLVGQGMTSVGSSGCGGIVSDGACSEQVARVAARHPGATNIDLSCRVAVCDRKGGSGTAVVTLANGTTVNDTFAYVGDPAPPPIPSCTGIAPDLCRTQAESFADNVAPSKHIVAISVTCTAASCTAARGEVDIRGTLGDGSTEQLNAGWEGAQP